MKTVYYHSGFSAPVLNWRESGSNAAFQMVVMSATGPGRDATERCWSARFGRTGVDCEFYIADATRRDPGNRWYEATSEISFLQDGQIFSYRPAPRVEKARRAYHPARVPTIKSRILGESRPYRVYLPRGYNQHLNRRYPVLYLHDGQNIFDSGAFGSWNAAPVLDRLTGRGQIREVIVVAVDSTPNRFNDYVPSEDGGRADKYVSFLVHELKPFIDRHYRTLTGSEHTAALGSSLGGVVSMYMGWDFFHVFGRVASMSGSWWLKKFQSRLVKQPKRPIRCYLDSGDSGYTNDGVHHTLELKQRLVEQTGFKPGDDFHHLTSSGHEHNEAAWGARLQHALRFLLPASEEETPELQRLAA